MNLLLNVVGIGFAMVLAIVLVGFCLGLKQWFSERKAYRKGGGGLKSRRTLWQCLAATFVLGVMEALVLPYRLWRFVLPSARSCRRSGLVGLANEGVHGTGRITKQTDAIITERYLLAKIGSDATHVAVCGAADTPIGVIVDEAAAVDDRITVALLGGQGGTLRMVASGAIAQGALVEPAASGRVQTLGAGVGVHQVVGRALDAAANAGDVIEVDPSYFLREI